MGTAGLIVILWIATLIGGDAAMQKRWIAAHEYLCRAETESTNQTVERGRAATVFICQSRRSQA